MTKNMSSKTELAFESFVEADILSGKCWKRDCDDCLQQQESDCEVSNIHHHLEGNPCLYYIFISEYIQGGIHHSKYPLGWSGSFGSLYQVVQLWFLFHLKFPWIWRHLSFVQGIHIRQQQNKVLCQVLLIWGCQWKCLAHFGGVSQVKLLSKTWNAPNILCSAHLLRWLGWGSILTTL